MNRWTDGQSWDSSAQTWTEVAIARVVDARDSATGAQAPYCADSAMCPHEAIKTQLGFVDRRPKIPATFCNNTGHVNWTHRQPKQVQAADWR